MLAVLLLEVERKTVDELNNSEQKVKQNLDNFFYFFYNCLQFLIVTFAYANKK